MTTTEFRYFPGCGMWAAYVDGERVTRLRSSLRRAAADLARLARV